MALLGLGLGVLFSALTTKYRDLRFFLQFGIQLLMYITPGIIMSYDSIILRFPKFKWIADINPIYPIIETFKHGWLNSGTFSLQSYNFRVINFFHIVIRNRHIQSNREKFYGYGMKKMKRLF